MYWGDETGIKNNTQYSRSFASVGKTPIRPPPAKRVSLNMISAITNPVKVRFMLYESTMKAKVLKRFLRALVESMQGKVFLILDNLRVLHDKVVKRWPERKNGKTILGSVHLGSILT